jgi:hypothetical protein
MADGLFALYHDPDQRRTLGTRARGRALARLSRNVVLEEFRRDMEEALAGRVAR